MQKTDEQIIGLKNLLENAVCLSGSPLSIEAPSSTIDVQSVHTVSHSSLFSYQLLITEQVSTVGTTL